MEQRSKRRETSRPPEQSNRRETGGRMAALGGPLEDSTMELELHVGATGASDYAARHTLPGQEANGGGGGEVGPGEGFAHGSCSHVVGPRAWPGSRISTVNRPHGRFRTARAPPLLARQPLRETMGGRSCRPCRLGDQSPPGRSVLPAKARNKNAGLCRYPPG
jgi:hypothetical protein